LPRSSLHSVAQFFFPSPSSPNLLQRAHSRMQANGSGRRHGSRRRRLSSGGARTLRSGCALPLGRSPPTRAGHGPPPPRLQSDLHHSSKQEHRTGCGLYAKMNLSDEVDFFVC
uniref:Uncharacterized protein n=6 Tax=Aegilops tauschii subsp. strangulata TaxID=200361 RepID=A0A453IH15_AEGTS